MCFFVNYGGKGIRGIEIVIILPQNETSMKHLAKKLLQTLLGFDNYLFLFSIYIIYTLRWNRNERDFLHFLGMLPDDGFVLDIGANIGIMTVHLARHLPNAKVFAFEPIPSNIKALRRIISFFDLRNVEIMDFALGNSDGEVEMVMPVLGSLPMQGLSHVLHESIPDLNEGRKYRTIIKKLDSISSLSENGLTLNAIKIDVENFEYFVLAGAERLIKLHRPIIYAELWENENRNKCFSFLQSMNYDVKVLRHGKLEPYKIGLHFTQNFFFIPSSLPPK
jgi:FkbM family methyltransferase